MSFKNGFIESRIHSFVESPCHDRGQPQPDCAGFNPDSYSGLANDFDITIEAEISGAGDTAIYIYTVTGDALSYSDPYGAPSIPLASGWWEGNWTFDRSGEMPTSGEFDPLHNDYPVVSLITQVIPNLSDAPYDSSKEISFLGFAAPWGHSKAWNNNGGEAGFGEHWPDLGGYSFLTNAWHPNDLTPTAPYEHDVYNTPNPSCPMRLWISLSGMQTWDGSQVGYSATFHIVGHRRW